MIFWGGTFIAGRILSRHLPPFSAGFLRYVIASLILLGLVLRASGASNRIKKFQILPLLILGLTGIFAYSFFFFKGLQTVEAGTASVIIATNPIFIAIFSAIIFRERLNFIQIIGVLISVCGAMLVITGGHILHIFHIQSETGILFIFLCVVNWVIYTLVGKRVLRGLSPLASVTYASFVGGFALGIAAVNEGIVHIIPGLAVQDWLCLLYLGIFGTVLGFVWYNEGVFHIGPTRASQFINLIPVASILLGFFLLDETISAPLILGSVLVVGGVFITNRYHREQKYV